MEPKIIKDESDLKFRLQIRHAEIRDLHSIARLHVETWNCAYAGILPHHVLCSYSLDRRIKQWDNILNNHNLRKTTIVAINNNELIGFCCFREQRSKYLQELGFTGEIAAIYINTLNQRRKIGRKLLIYSFNYLINMNHTSISAWTLDRNIIAKNFYIGLGAKSIFCKTEEIEGFIISEIAYGWGDIRHLE